MRNYSICTIIALLFVCLVWPFHALAGAPPDPLPCGIVLGLDAAVCTDALVAASLDLFIVEYTIDSQQAWPNGDEKEVLGVPTCTLAGCVHEGYLKKGNSYIQLSGIKDIRAFSQDGEVSPSVGSG